MIERQVAFDVLPGKEQAFESLFKQEYAAAMSKQPGFVSVGLVREQDAPTRYKMLIRFDSLEAAAGWRNSEDHKALSPRIKALYSNSSVVVYEVIA